ncbi:MAG: hypothetical protein J6Y57_05285 [Lachnospiraceae bacterium]|nr:hypothetical protein [Lachnospiraceae bacterium]
MNKKIQAYKKNMLKQEFFLLDVTNLILGIAIIVVTVLALMGEGGALMHSLVFLLGGIMMLLNTIKNVRRQSLLAVTFAVFTILMFGIYAYILYFYLHMG